MPLDATFFRDVDSLRAPLMGTEHVGPLLYWLVRSRRPDTVLEIGMGYTTPFLAQALADNARDWERGRAAMVEKCARLADGPADREGITRWLAAEPSLGAMDFYRQRRAPRLHAIDDLSNGASSAPRVAEVLRRASVDAWVTVHDGDAHALRGRIASEVPPIDLLWCDCDRTVHVFDDYWDLVSPNGGLFMAHALLGDAGGPAVLDYLLDTLERRGEAFEMMNLDEPHKVAQNGLTILRRTNAEIAAPFAAADGAALTREARRFVRESEPR